MLATHLLSAQEMKIFRIGTGGAGGTYYPVGGLIAQAISSPPDSRICDKREGCGVPGLIAVPQSANGSVANVEAIGTSALESGFAQSDVAYWAYTGSGVFDGRKSISSLRAITNLYRESIHLVARRGANIKSVHDLKGKRISLDEPGSGTLVDARVILGAFGLSERDIKPEYIKPSLASEKIHKNTLDAFFLVAGYPAKSIIKLASVADIELVPIDGPERNDLLNGFELFSTDTIPAGVYKDIGATETISVSALWLVGADVEESLVYSITGALWSKNSRKLLANGHSKGKNITIETALEGVGIPLHPGAARYYSEIGMTQ